MLINKKREYMKYIIFGVMLIVLISPLVNAQQTTTTDAGITPDSLFWGLDKAFDQINLLLTTGNVDKAKKGLEIAEERLAEIREMIEENELEAAEKAQEEHGKTLLKVKEKIKEVEEEDPLEEIENVIKIEKEVEDHDDKIEQTFGELKVKIEIKGKITQAQKDLINSILNSLKGQTGEVEIEIENKKNKIKIEQETGKTEEEIEIEIENIEKEKGIKKQEKALEAIEEAEEELNEFLEDAEEENITIPQDVIDQFNSLLDQAKIQFDQGSYVEAIKLAKQAEKLLDDEEDKEELDENKIEVEIKDGKAEVEVEIGDSEWEFELETTDLDTIINEISSRTDLSAGEINAIMKVEIEEEGEEQEDEDELEDDEENGQIEDENNEDEE